MNPTILSVLSAAAAAAWSVWTWQSERQKERDLKRDEMSAQYVNTFLVLTQELQRTLFKILEEDGLEHYRQKSSQAVAAVSPAAVDILYQLSGFFGWGLVNFRFGPYTRDSEMIALMAQIAETLDSDGRFPGEAFRFTLSDRMALSATALRRMGESSSRPIFAVVSRFQFEAEMVNEGSEHARLFASDQVRCTVEAIDRAVGGEALEGRERLAELQNLLVDLVSYLEHKEAFRVSYGERRRAKVDTRLGGVASQQSKEVQVLHRMPGRFRLGIARLHFDKQYAVSLQTSLQSLPQVKSVRLNAHAACAVVEHADDLPQDEVIQAVVAQAKQIDEKKVVADQIEASSKAPVDDIVLQRK